MNLPNKLTLLRIVLTPIFMLLFVWEFPFHYFAAMLVFIAASVTDLMDGKIARKYSLVTDFGKFLDPLADKMLTTAAFVGFLAKGIGYGSVWILFIVLFREFAVSSIRLVTVSSGGKVIAANIWGKLKTVLQMTAIIFTLVAQQAVEIVNIPAVSVYFTGIFAPDNIALWLEIMSSVLLWASTAVCVISGVKYLTDNKEFINHTK